MWKLPMSRNLGRTNCYFCYGEVIRLEKPRFITEDEAGPYYKTYSSMSVSKAQCVQCEAKYLAWVAHHSYDNNFLHTYYLEDNTPVEAREKLFFDLSFRSTFNDEPGNDDYPVYEIKTENVRIGPYKRKERS